MAEVATKYKVNKRVSTAESMNLGSLVTDETSANLRTDTSVDASNVS
jgi:hypothetical protein